MYKGQIRPTTGCPCLFPPEMEEDIALFMKHCTFLHIPRSKQILKEDILHFVQYKGMNIQRMAEDGPGSINKLYYVDTVISFGEFNSRPVEMCFKLMVP